MAANKLLSDMVSVLLLVHGFASVNAHAMVHTYALRAHMLIHMVTVFSFCTVLHIKDHNLIRQQIILNLYIINT